MIVKNNDSNKIETKIEICNFITIRLDTSLKRAIDWLDFHTFLKLIRTQKTHIVAP